MLVKELRQGMRTRVFISVFLTLQIFLALIMLSAGAATSSDNAGNTISNVIFSLFCLAVLIVQPLRGVGALSSEIKSNTIDMMVLTRLSAARIVLGKWFAIVSQSALILVTIIPYVILRYFLGGMNFLGEISLLSLVFVTSATLTAVTVGISASSSVILRSILPMIAAPVFGWTLLVMSFGNGFAQLISLCSFDSPSSITTISIYVATCLYFAYFFLSIGSSLIAPFSENHSTVRRLVALGVTILATALCSQSSLVPSDRLLLIYSLIFTPIFLASLSEFSRLVPPIYAPFEKRGAVGKLAALFLLPGWASGVFYCLLLTLVALVAFILNPSTYNGTERASMALSCLGALLFPGLLINLFRSEGPQRLSNYFLFLIASVFLAGVLFGLAESMSNRAFLWLFVWIPTVLFPMAAAGTFDDSSVLFAAFAVNLLLLALLLLTAIKNYRDSLQAIEPEESPAET